MEQVRVRIGDDEILVSGHPPDRPPDGQRHGAEGIRATDSGEVVVVSRDGQCWKFPPVDLRLSRSFRRPERPTTGHLVMPT
jgi:hypothetical protein